MNQQMRPSGHALSRSAPALGDAQPACGNDGNRCLDRILKTRDVLRITGMHRCTIYRWMLANRFPQKHSFRGRKVGWRQSDIEEWLAGDKGKLG